MSELAASELREAIGRWLVKNLFWGIDYQRGPEAADRMLTEVPELRDLLAAAEERDALLACSGCGVPGGRHWDTCPNRGDGRPTR